MRLEQRQLPFKLRLEPNLKHWLQVRARENKRSLNSEVLYVLERYRQGKEAQHG